MGSTSGKRRASKHSSPRPAASRPGVQLASTVLGVVGSGVAWVFLVGAAIDFGMLGVHGHPVGWVFAAGASVGAVVCLVLLMVLVTRVLRAVGVIKEYKPRRAGGRRSAGAGSSAAESGSGTADSDAA